MRTIASGTPQPPREVLRSGDGAGAFEGGSEFAIIGISKDYHLGLRRQRANSAALMGIVNGFGGGGRGAVASEIVLSHNKFRHHGLSAFVFGEAVGYSKEICRRCLKPDFGEGNSEWRQI